VKEAAPRRNGSVLRAGLVGAIFCAGCGGGSPLLHPARTLTAGDVRAAAGLSSTFSLGGFSDATRDAVREAGSNAAVPGPPGSDPTYSKGAAVAASLGAGVAPFVSARVGIGWQSDGGLAYTGRAIRADFRRSFDLSDTWALSVGAGGSAVLYGHQDGGALPNVDLDGLHGWGADIPVLIGYQSSGDLYMLWIGARGGWEHVDISAPASSNAIGPLPYPLSADRFWAGPLLGFAVGFRHLHVAVELDSAFASISADYNGSHVQVGGAALTPATALWWKF
jgi:hypothetical protein